MKTVPIRKDGVSVRMEYTADDLIRQTQRILEIKNKAMKEGVHFGIIPGCQKPSLWKPGAEKMCQAFRLNPEFETLSKDDPNRTMTWKKWDYKNKKDIEGTTRGYIEYESRCTLIHIPTEEVWAKNVSASCNNFEARYRSLNPNDVKNTLAKMSEKRSLVAAVLIGTAASDIFTQDIEDLPEAMYDDDAPTYNQDKGKTKNQNGGPSGNGNNGKAKNKKQADPEIRMATERQVNYIKMQIEKKQIEEDAFFEEWGDYFESWDAIAFNVVNDVLKWISEQ